MNATLRTLLACKSLLLIIFFGVHSVFAEFPAQLGDNVLPTIGKASVTEFRLSPDGQWALYLADEDTSGAQELYRVPSDDGPVVKLSGSLVAGGDVKSFQISADGTRVVYRADQNTDGIFELYSVPLAGGTVVKLNGPLPTGGEVDDYEISADNQWVVYRADQDTFDVCELYSVPLAGGLSLKLNGGLVAGGEVDSNRLSPDGEWVVYRADQDMDGVHELYSVPINLGPRSAVKLNGPLTEGEVRAEYEIAPDSDFVVYRAKQDQVTGPGLHQVPMGGGSSIKLNDTVVPLGGKSIWISPDSGWIVFGAISDDLPGVDQLYSVPAGGGAVVQLNDTLVQGGEVALGALMGGIFGPPDVVRISPDSTRVVYRADQDTAGLVELYSVPIAGGPVVKLNGPLGLGFLELFDISPDSSRVIYSAVPPGPSVWELFGVPIDGGAQVKLNGPIVSGGGVTSFRFSPNGDRVLYQAFQDLPTNLEIYSVQAMGGQAVKLNGTLQETGNVYSDFAITPDSARVVYRGDQDTDNLIELYTVPIGGGEEIKLNSEVPRGPIDFFHLSADAYWAVYQSDRNGDGSDELYSVPVEGGMEVQLVSSMNPNGTLAGLKVSPDNTQVLVRGDLETEGVFELFVVPIAGGPMAKINDPLVPGGDVSTVLFEFSPDGNQVIYVADQDTDGVFELYSKDLGTGALQKLNGPMVAGGGVALPLRFTPDGSRIIYTADQDTNDIFEIYSASIEGGSLVKLNGTLPGGSSATGFEITPDGRWIVYRAGEGSSFDLFRASSEGGVPLKLNQTPQGASTVVGVGGIADAFQISPDGSRVVFRAEVNGSGFFELYSVPIEGGPATRISGPLVNDGDVWGYQISPDARRVVYRAEQETLGKRELYSVPISGGRNVKLNKELESLSIGSSQFRISPDSVRVVYSGVETNAIEELYSVLIGGGLSVKLSAGLTTGFFHEISPDGRRVYFVDHAGRDLYTVPIEGGPVVQVNSPLVHLSSPTAYEFRSNGEVIFNAEDALGSGALYQWRGQSRWTGGGGDWFSPENWEGGIPPQAGFDAIISDFSHVVISGNSCSVGSLLLGGGGGSSVLAFENGAHLSVESNTEILSGGVLRGDGILALGSHSLALMQGAELQIGGGQLMSILGGLVTNAGRAEVLGTLADPAELHFDGEVTNVAGAGALLGHNAIMKFGSGLINEGALTFGNGLNDVLGPVQNASGGVIVVSGGATTIFADDVANQGIINVSAVGGLQSAAVFFGALTGNGISGAGAVFIEGDTRPGFSPGTMFFGGDVTYGPLASLELELGGPVRGSDYDELVVAGHLHLDGTLKITFLDGFTPTEGMEFDFWDAATVSGEFRTMLLPELPPGLIWDTESLRSDGMLSVMPTALTYTQFATAFGLAGGPFDDDEGDGLSNLQEWVFGLNPLLVDAHSWSATLDRNGGESIYQFEMRELLGTDIVVEIESSGSMEVSDWTVLAQRVGSNPWMVKQQGVTIGASTTTSGAQLVTLHHQTSALRMFYRIKITLLP